MNTITIQPKYAESFKKQMLESGWTITKQDAGQIHIVGWGYMIEWQKGSHRVCLHYKDLQGIAEARLEITPDAFKTIQNLLKTGV
jgi:hypothetical protein